MTKLTETVASVQNAPTSIFSKEDVLKILKGLQEAEEVVDEDDSDKPEVEDLIREFYDRVCSTVSEAVDNVNDEDVADYSTAEFGLEGNEIQLENVDINKNTITDEIEGDLKSMLDEFLDEFEITSKPKAKKSSKKK